MPGATPSKPPTVPVTPGLQLDREERALIRGTEKIPLHEKPFLLLEALLELRGRVVPREDLYRAVWPNIDHLDFEANLNATVRKLRQALGDSATAPRWIETVPGRGYRLLPLNDRDGESVPEQATESSPQRDDFATPRRLFSRSAAAIALVVGAVALAAFFRPSPVPGSEDNLRIGIVRFERTALATDLEETLTWVSESILQRLAQELDGRAEVIGPRSTISYEDHPFPRLRDLRTDLQLDYILNARLIQEDSVTALLVELIRLPDGAHSWVERFDPGQEPEEIVVLTVQGVVSTVETSLSKL